MRLPLLKTLWRTGSSKLQVTFFSLFPLALLLCACDPTPEIEPSQIQVDAEVINNVWHKAKLRGVAFRAIGLEPAQSDTVLALVRVTNVDTAVKRFDLNSGVAITHRKA